MTAPLVVAVRVSTLRDVQVWVEHGRGWLLDPIAARWVELTEAPGLGGRVLTRSEVDALAAKHGRPA